jgi:serine/threonine-protein kinase
MDTLGLPAVFGRYLLLRRLSRGGMGEIFLAKVGEIQGMEKLCIIKKVLPQLAEDQGFIRRFVDEAQIAIKLQHANIAPVYEVGMVGGEYFLAMEYVDGRDLRRTLSRAHEVTARLHPDLALYIVREIANGLAYAHRRTDENGKEMHIVHCDVSPPNVLLSFEGEVKLIDFGIAKSRQQLSITDPNVGFGKFGYMAPEQLVRGRKVDRRTDIYAAGVILYELLVGDRMVVQNEGSDYRSLARMIASGKIDPPSKRDPSVPPELDELVMKAIAAEPDQRFQTAEELREAVQRRLYAINPTISSDTPAKLLRDFFGAEANEDHALLAQARALDLAPFREELDGARTHTVSFALAAPFEDGRTAPRERSTSGRTEIVNLTHRLTWPRVAVASSALVLLAAAAVAAIRAWSSKEPVAPAAVAAKPPAEKPTPKVEEVQPPVPTPLPPIEPMIVQRPRPTSKPQGTRTKQAAARPSRTIASAAPHGATQAQVEAKYRAVHREYDDFKRAFGPRLDPSWNRILEQFTFGQGDAKYSKIDTMLDEFRREMAKVKSGG